MAVHLSTAGLDPGDRTRLSFGRLKIVFYEDIKRKCRPRSALFLLKVRGKSRYNFEIVCRYFVSMSKNYRLIYLLSSDLVSQGHRQ